MSAPAIMQEYFTNMTLFLKYYNFILLIPFSHFKFFVCKSHGISMSLALSSKCDQLGFVRFLCCQLQTTGKVLKNNAAENLFAAWLD